MYKVAYIGNYYKFPEYIYHNTDYKLEYIISEKGKVNDDLFTFSQVRGIRIYEVSQPEEIGDLIVENKVDCMLMFSFGKKIPDSALQLVPFYNFHYSILPKYKGRHPIFYGIINNEKELGVTLMKVDKGLDTGEIISRECFQNYIWDNDLSLSEKAIKKVPILLKKLKQFLDKGGSTEKNTHGEYYAPVNEKDYTIDVKKDTPSEIYNKVKAQNRYNGAKIEVQGSTYWLKEIVFTKIDTPKNKKVGEFLNSEDSIVVYKNGVGIRLIRYAKCLRI